MCIAKMEIIAVTLTSTLSRPGRLLPDCVLLRVKGGGAAEFAVLGTDTAAPDYPRAAD
jgi:hypothetical protein